MAMTKKERAEMDAAIDRAMMLGALRWTSPVNPDVPIPSGLGIPEANGWQFNTSTGRVYQAWSTQVSHGEGPTRKGYGSQRGIRLYSTKLFALKAMRHEMELQLSKKLMAVDKEIAEEEAKP